MKPHTPNSITTSKSVLNLGDGVRCANQIINDGLRCIRSHLDAAGDVACRFVGISKRPGHFHFDILLLGFVMRWSRAGSFQRHSETQRNSPDLEEVTPG